MESHNQVLKNLKYNLKVDTLGRDWIAVRHKMQPVARVPVIRYKPLAGPIQYMS